LKFFYINICGFITSYNFYARPEYLTIAISDLKFNLWYYPDNSRWS